MTSHCITWHDTTQAITSHQMTWPSHDLTPQQTSRHQNTSLQNTKHHHHGTAEGSFTAKKWFGHRAGRSPCAHSIGKFFLWLIVFSLWNFRPRLVRALLVWKQNMYLQSLPFLYCFYRWIRILRRHQQMPSTHNIITVPIPILSYSRIFYLFHQNSHSHTIHVW